MADKRIRLFVDAHAFDQGFQGTQTFIRELYTRLLADHPELDIYFGARDVQNIRNIFPDLPPTNILPYKKRGAGLFRLVFDIPAYIKKYQFDFAHFQYLIPKRSPHCRYIVTLHDALFNDFQQDFSFFFRITRNLLFGRSIKLAPIKTTVSEYSKQRICNYYNIPQDELHVIPNGVNDEFVQFHHSRPEAAELVGQKFGIKNFILYVSRIEPRKNQLLLLKKYLKLGLYKQGIALVFIGKESVQVPALSKLIRNLNKEQKKLFHWIWQTDQSDLVAFYRACRLFVYPSKAEGFGIPPLEAAACLAPVLCSSVTAMKDFVFFEPYIFDPADDTDFEQKLSWMINEPPSCAFTAKVAAHIQQHYNWEQSSNLFFNLLQANYSI